LEGPQSGSDMTEAPQPHDGGDLAGMSGHVVGNRSKRQRFLLSTTVVTIPGTLALVGIPFAIGWPPAPEVATAGDRIAYALPWCFAAFLPYAAVCLTILQMRLSQGAHNPLAQAEDEQLKIHCRVMQNNLEQLLWYLCCALPLSVCLEPDQLPLLPITAIVFVGARLAYWAGYFRNGTLGRRYGVQMTFTINIGLLILTAASLVSSWLT